MAGEDIYRAIFNTAPDAMILVDTEGRIVKVNYQVTEIFGYKREELTGQSVEFLIPERFAVSHIEHRQGFYKSPKRRPMGTGHELLARRKDGSEFYVEISLSPLTIGNRKFTSAAIRDVTEKIEVYERLQHSLSVIESKNRELEQFAYIASHDLKEPLRTISGFVMLLEKECKDHLEGDGHVYLNFIAEAASRMSLLIKDLLDYSLIGQNKEFKDVDCNFILRNLLKDLSASITESNAFVEVGKLPSIHGSETEIKLLFQNLLANAIKFRNKEVRPVISISAREEEDHWRFSVDDNGIGIPEEQKEKIFGIFQRLHSRSEYEGTGLGLAHCRKIVELHGGKIWVESSPRKGSTFLFTIPKGERSK